MNVIIRPWEKDDLSAIQSVTWETWLATYSAFIPQDDLQTYFEAHYNLAALAELFNSREVNGWVAEAEKAIVGYLKTQRHDEEKRFYVSSVYVLPTHQGKGIGMKLLRQAEACATAYHFDKIWLGVMAPNFNALAWYKKIGFEFIEEAPFTMGQTTVNHLIGYKRCDS
jgi:ribosomal protein S18 acetylase RimI-like enzyme